MVGTTLRTFDKAIMGLGVVIVISLAGAYVDFRVNENVNKLRFAAIQTRLAAQVVGGVPIVEKITTNTEWMRMTTEQVGVMYNEIIKELDKQNEAMQRLSVELKQHSYHAGKNRNYQTDKE